MSAKPSYAPNVDTLTRGKTGRQLKEIIAVYRKQIDYLDQRIMQLEKSREHHKVTKQTQVRKAAGRAWKNQKRKYSVAQSELNQRAEEWYYDKVKAWRLKSMSFMDGVSAIPIFKKLAGELEISEITLSLFILISHLKWFAKSDAEPWGFSKQGVMGNIKILEELGWIEMFQKGNYVTSIKGKKVFTDLQTQFSKNTLLLFGNLDLKYKDRTGKTFVKGLVPKTDEQTGSKGNK